MRKAGYLSEKAFLIVCVLYCIYMRHFLQIGLLFLFIGALLFPSSIWYQTNGALLTQVPLDSADFYYLLFPLFGLLGFGIIWTQLMLGTFMDPLGRLFGRRSIFLAHVYYGIFSLIIIPTHPLLSLIAQIMRKGWVPQVILYDFIPEEKWVYVLIGIIAFDLYLAAVLAGLLRNKPWFQRHWRRIHYFQYAVFFLVLIHSLFVGSHTQGLLQYVYLFYGITAIAGLWYRRVYQEQRKRAINH